MSRSLRARFIFSHILPLLVVLPLVGLILVYVLESQVMLENLAAELEKEALLVARVAGAHGELWHDPAQAYSFVMTMHTQVRAQVTLMRLDGTLVSSSDPLDAERRGKPLEMDEWPDVASGETGVFVPRGLALRQQSVTVLVPVWGSDQRVVGVVGLSYLVEGLKARFMRHRWLIVGVLVGGLVVGVVTGVVLAVNLERPLRQVTLAVSALADGERLEPLIERGPHETRLLVRAVNTLLERLQSLERARRILLANLIHELGRPLGAFRSAIQALQRGADQDADLRRDLLAGMDQEVDRMRRLLDDLSMLHDRVVGALELDRRPTDLNQWLVQTLGPWREAAHAKGLAWQTDLDGPLPVLHVDPDRLGQALGNLLSNAIKFTPPGGTVSVLAGVEADGVWIAVGDTGPGITLPDGASSVDLVAGQRRPVFEPLYRNRPGRRFPSGMGLGLSIANDLVIAHGGRLEVESAPGRGSRFTLSIPRTKG
jgi:two-component system, OmpR family, sensor histidine kinase BaeS